MPFITFRTGPASTPPGGFLAILIRWALLAAAAMALLTLVLVGLLVVLPLILVGGAVASFYLRRRMRQARQRPPDGVIDAEYTIIDHR